MEPHVLYVEVPEQTGRSAGPVAFRYFPGAEQDIHDVLSGREYPLHKAAYENVRVIVDIGGHVGSAALFFRCQFPDADIYSFEPMAETFALLENNVGWHPKAHLFNFGMADRDATQTIHHAEHLGFGASSVQATTDHEGASSKIELRDAYAVLNELGIRHIDILKIDTEGFEPKILARMEALLPDTDVIVLEIHSDRARVTIDALLLPNFTLIHADTSRTNRLQAIYLNRAAIARGAVQPVLTAPAIDLV